MYVNTVSRDTDTDTDTDRKRERTAGGLNRLATGQRTRADRSGCRAREKEQLFTALNNLFLLRLASPGKIPGSRSRQE